MRRNPQKVDLFGLNQTKPNWYCSFEKCNNDAFFKKVYFFYAKQFHSSFVSIIKSWSSFVSSLADVPPGWIYWMQKHALQCIISLTGDAGIRFVQDSRYNIPDVATLRQAGCAWPWFTWSYMAANKCIRVPGQGFMNRYLFTVMVYLL